MIGASLGTLKKNVFRGFILFSVCAWSLACWRGAAERIHHPALAALICCRCCSLWAAFLPGVTRRQKEEKRCSSEFCQRPPTDPTRTVQTSSMDSSRWTQPADPRSFGIDGQKFLTRRTESPSEETLRVNATKLRGGAYERVVE